MKAIQIDDCIAEMKAATLTAPPAPQIRVPEFDEVEFLRTIKTIIGMEVGK